MRHLAALNRRKKTIFHDLTFTESTSDELGPRITERDQAGKVTQFFYDSLARLDSPAARHARTIEQLAGHLDVLPSTADAAAHYSQIRAALRRAGRPAGVHDMLIGGHARSEGLILVTNHIREFARMPGLQLENWVGEG